MKLLALDTSTLTSSVAVVEDAVVLAEGEARAETHSEQLLPLIDDVLRRAGVAPAALDAIACGAGPGSFTGLRIGLATAKGLCFALGRPLVLVSSLRALAYPALGRDVLALLDARKREVYAGIFDAAGEPVAPEVVLPPARLRDHLGDRRLVVVGDGAITYPDVAAACGEVLSLRPTPSAAAVAALALARLARGERDELLTAAPTYVRASEAEIATPPSRPGPARP